MKRGKLWGRSPRHPFRLRRPRPSWVRENWTSFMPQFPSKPIFSQDDARRSCRLSMEVDNVGEATFGSLRPRHSLENQRRWWVLQKKKKKRQRDDIDSFVHSITLLSKDEKKGLLLPYALATMNKENIRRSNTKGARNLKVGRDENKPLKGTESAATIPATQCNAPEMQASQAIPFTKTRKMPTPTMLSATPKPNCQIW